MSGSPVRLPPPDLPAGPRSALVVATTSYIDPSLRQLRAPATDAAEFAAILADPAIGGFGMTSVLDRTAHEVRVAIDEFLTGRTPDELVVLYVSCHGITDPRRRLYFAAADTRTSHLPSTGVDATWVNDRLDECRARRQILILDCCFSGAFARGTKGIESLSLDGLTEPGRGRAVLTASNANEYSFEATASDDGAVEEDSPGAGSVFTAALLDGLRDGKADADADGVVTVDEAYAYAYRQVRASGAAQTPQRWLSSGEGQLVFARNPTGRPIVLAPVPDSLRAALENPLPRVRIGAVAEMEDWLTSDDRGKAASARRELETIANSDIPRVAEAARIALQQAPTTQTLGDSAEPTDAMSPTASDNGPTDGPSERSDRSHVRVAAVVSAKWPPRPDAEQNVTTSAPAVTSAAYGPTSEAAVLRGHTGGRGRFSSRVNAVVFSPDGRRLVSGASDKTVRLWDPETGRSVRTLTGHLGMVNSVAFSPDGRLLASGADDRTVRLWDPETGEHVQTLAGHVGTVNSVAFSPDGRLLASGADDKTMRLWEPRASKHFRAMADDQVRGVKELETNVTAVAFSPDGRLLASGTDGGSVDTLQVWSPETGELVRTFTGHIGKVYAVAFSADGHLLASAEGVLKLTNPETGEQQPIRTLRGSGQVNCVAFSPDGRVLAVGSTERGVLLWDVQTHELIRELIHSQMVRCVAFSPDGRLLATGDSETVIRVWK